MNNPIKNMVIVISCVAFLAIPANVFAHAYVDHASPAVGATVAEPPQVLKIWFTQPLLADGSDAEIDDASGKRMDKKDSHLDDKDHALLIVSLQELPPGVYSVHWHAQSRDTHHTEGDFKFTVKGK